MGMRDISGQIIAKQMVASATGRPQISTSCANWPPGGHYIGPDSTKMAKLAVRENISQLMVAKASKASGPIIILKTTRSDENNI